ncbi:MAG: hypothetical protein K0R75_641 [Paenibacillaceae bacterium]|jgi:hypothetical protein|nr:hypothetical protein [Paenibacillaceae bacterium]
MRYVEQVADSSELRDRQYESALDFLERQSEAMEQARRGRYQLDLSSVENYVRSKQEYVSELLEAIGYAPLAALEVGGSAEGAGAISCEEVFVGEEDHCRISRLFLTVAPGLTFYGMYMTPKALVGKTPLMILIHGGNGCPEILCGLERDFNYANAARRFVDEGYAVFAPALYFEVRKDGEKSQRPQHTRWLLDSRARCVGTSLAALELFKLRQAITYLQGRAEIGAGEVGVSGLSHGGYYTLLLAATDERVGFCIPSGYFHDRFMVYKKARAVNPCGLDDLRWPGVVHRFSDADLVRLVCPKLCIIEKGIHDNSIPAEYTRAAARQVAETYEQLGIADRFYFLEFDGGHQYDLTEALEVLRRARDLTMENEGGVSAS